MTERAEEAEAPGNPYRLSVAELSGALGDVGTLLPLMLGAMAVGGLAPTPVLAGFGLFYIATALYYRLPIPVQPMKAVAAVLLTAELSPGAVVATGVMVGVALLVLGATGWITRLARLVPQSVLAGLQLGLGAALALVSVKLMGASPGLGLFTMVLLLVLLAAPRLPAALIALVAAGALGHLLDVAGLESAGGVDIVAHAVPFAMPGWADIQQALSVAVLPQLTLTLMNAVVLTALLAQDYFGERARHVTPARLCLTSGLANLLLTPLGALPMCHGAGGLAAHYRFGARSGTAPLMLGLVLLVLAALPGNAALMLLAAIPMAAVGALLLMAAAQLALTRRMFDARPSCWPVIATTALVTLWIDPFWGLLAGCLAELVRVALLRTLKGNVARF